MIIYGKQVCLYALTHHFDKIKTLYIANKSANSKDVLPKDLFHKYHDKIKFLEEKWAKSMCKGGNHQGILVEIDDLTQTSFNNIKQSDFILVLDGLTDVGNIGAIVRTAYALGVDSIIMTGVNNLNLSAITRTSSGAMLDMDFMINKNILDHINELSQLGFIFYGAMMDGIDINKLEFNQKRVLVLGNEGDGISKKITKKLNQKVSIEMKHEFNSLNVNSAGSILIHRMSYAVK
jgi:23S rRNA (guanosine2251-2'-O)-methyltransferase